MRTRCLLGDTECKWMAFSQVSMADDCSYVWGDNVQKAKTQAER